MKDEDKTPDFDLSESADNLSQEEIDRRFDYIIHHLPRSKTLPADWDDPEDAIWDDWYEEIKKKK